MAELPPLLGGPIPMGPPMVLPPPLSPAQERALARELQSRFQGAGERLDAIGGELADGRVAGALRDVFVPGFISGHHGADTVLPETPPQPGTDGIALGRMTEPPGLGYALDTGARTVSLFGQDEMGRATTPALTLRADSAGDTLRAPDGTPMGVLRDDGGFELNRRNLVAVAAQAGPAGAGQARMGLGGERAGDGVLADPIAPPSPPLPGFSPPSEGDRRLLGRPETLPIDPAAGLPHILSTPAAPPLPGMEQGPSADEARGPHVMAMATDFGRMDLPRTPGLGPSASMAELLARQAVPGREGVVVTDPVRSPSELFPGMFRLFEANGAEYSLARHDGKLVLYSGAPNRVRMPVGAEPLGHTHGGNEPLPSRADIDALDDMWARNPDAPRPSSYIIWGAKPDEATWYGATGMRPASPAGTGLPR